MDFPKISVITTTYKHQDFILNTLQGVINQKYEGNIEFIIANDNSPDDTDNIIVKFLENEIIPNNIEVKYVKHDKNKGMMNNFLWCLNICSGEYIAICEGDDYWVDNNKLKKQLTFFQNDADVKICCSNYFELKNNIQSSDLSNNVDETKSFNFDDLLKNNMIATLTVLFKNPGKNVWNDFQRIVDENEFLMADYIVWLLLLVNGGKVIKFNENTSVYRFLEESASHTNDTIKLARFEEGVLKLRKLFLVRKYNNHNITRNRLLCDILNSSYSVFLDYNNELSLKNRKKILKELQDNSLSLSFKNRLKKIYRCFIKI